jgi:hypothetical protein
LRCTNFVIENSGDVITRVSLTHDLSQELAAVITQVTMEPVGSSGKKKKKRKKTEYAKLNMCPLQHTLT